MSWAEEAQRAWADHCRAEQDRDEARAARTVDYVERLRDRLHARPTAGTDRLGEQEHAIVEGELVRLALTNSAIHRGRTTGRHPWPNAIHGVELRAEVVTDGVPDVHVWLLIRSGLYGLDEWVDRGTVETLADLGRAFDPHVVEVGPAPEEQSTGDLLLTVLTAIVRDVVASELDGRLSGGPP